MFLRSLYLQYFRNYEEAYFEFSPHFNLICGPNAQGKTTLLEAIYCLITGRSFRAHHHQELIKHGQRSFYAEVSFSKHGIDQKLKIYFDGKTRHFTYNSTPFTATANLFGIIPGAVLTPDDIQLIKGSPQLRRQFLDTQIAQIDPLYVHHATRYMRAMKHRNQLLKAKQPLSIETWEHEMCQSAAYLIVHRKLAIEQLRAHAEKIYQALSREKEPFSVKYHPSISSEQSADDLRRLHLEQLIKYRPREMVLGHTLVGPHKDELIFTIGDKDVRHFASEGQQRSCIIAIRLAEWQHLHQCGQEPPLMMLDDVGISLDVHRRRQLLELLKNKGQVFLTTTDETLLNECDVDKKILSVLKD